LSTSVRSIALFALVCIVVLGARHKRNTLLSYSPEETNVGGMHGVLNSEVFVFNPPIDIQLGLIVHDHLEKGWVYRRNHKFVRGRHYSTRQQQSVTEFLPWSTVFIGGVTWEGWEYLLRGLKAYYPSWAPSCIDYSEFGDTGFCRIDRSIRRFSNGTNPWPIGINHSVQLAVNRIPLQQADASNYDCKDGDYGVSESSVAFNPFPEFRRHFLVLCVFLFCGLAMFCVEFVGYFFGFVKQSPWRCLSSMLLGMLFLVFAALCAHSIYQRP
jgi:hypothetical protein